MLNDILKEVVVSVVGKPGEGLADLLNTNKHVNEFIIAKKLDLTINQTRNLLYKISDQGLLLSLKKKDKKKGWFTYFWKIDILKTLEFYRSNLLARKSHLDSHVNSRETKEFFECLTCGIEVTAENALIYDFTCPECGKVFTQKDNTKILRELRNESEKITKVLEEVEIEIEKEKSKVGKSRAREVAKEKKEKAEKRAFNRKVNAKKRELKRISEGKVAKKTTKKVTPKTTKKIVRKAAKKQVKKKGLPKKALGKEAKRKSVKTKVQKALKKVVKKKIAKKSLKKSSSKSKSKKN